MLTNYLFKGGVALRDSLGNKIPKRAFIIRHTEIPEFRNCRRNWYFSSAHGRNLEPRIKSIKLDAGSMWHKGLEYKYQGKKLSEGLEAAFEEQKDSYTEMLFFNESATDAIMELQESFNLALEIAKAYDSWCNSPEVFPKDSELKILATEKRFIVPLTPYGTPTITWIAAKLDGLVEFKNMLFSLEHKYLSKSTQVNNPEHLPLDLQMGIQLLVLSKVFSGLNIGGAIYNLTRKQRPSSRVMAPLFGRHLVERSPQELDNLETALYYDSQAMRQCLKDSHLRYPNPQPFGGMCTWGCKYRLVCEAMNRNEDYEYLLTARFQKRQLTLKETLLKETQLSELSTNTKGGD